MLKLPPEIIAKILETGPETYCVLTQTCKKIYQIGKYIEESLRRRWIRHVFDGFDEYYLLPNGKKHGPCIIWYDKERTRKRCEFRYENGIIHGQYKEYYHNGRIREISFFNAGEFHGMRKMWYENGKLLLLQTFDDKKKVLETWYPDGKRYEKCVFMKDRTVSYEWYRNGNLASLLKTWRKKDIVVKSIKYFENGKKSQEERYKKYYLQGERKIWYRDGKLCFVGHYKKGRRNGKFKLFYENGRRWIFCRYKNDEILEKTAKIWDRNGRKIDWRKGIRVVLVDTV